MKPKLEIFYKKEQNFDFKKLNRVECTTLKTFIFILNFLRAHVSICFKKIILNSLFCQVAYLL